MDVESVVGGGVVSSIGSFDSVFSCISMLLGTIIHINYVVIL